MSQLKFGKTEKLKSRKAIKRLFATGTSVYSYPVKFLFDISDNKAPMVKCGVSVAKKKHRKAVTRNLLKRRLREAYRLNKEEIIQISKIKNISLEIFIIYLPEKVQNFHSIEAGVKACLAKLKQKILETSTKNIQDIDE